MNLQVFGTPKCKETQKALRWLKERSMVFHFRDITVKAPAPAELDTLARALGGPQTLVDDSSPEYLKFGLAHMDYDPREELLRRPLLMKTPVLRDGTRAVLGFSPDSYKEFTHE